MTNTNKHKELEPCPFCDGTAQLSETEGCDYVCVCSECGAMMNDDMLWGEDGYNAKSNIISKWNARTDTQELKQLRRDNKRLLNDNKRMAVRKLELCQERDELSAYVERLREIINSRKYYRGQRV